MRYKKLFLVVVFLVLSLISIKVMAQVDQSLNVFGFKLLNYQDNYLPENLLASRSAVFISTLPKQNGARGDWKAFCHKSHFYLKRIGIDPVAYFNNEDVFSGEEPQKNFIDWIKLRKVENLIFLTERMENGQKEFTVVITALNEKNGLAEHGQPGWKMHNTDLERIFVLLYRTAAAKNLKKENYLIVDTPEIFSDIPLHKGKRFETYQPDLKLDKLAVPKFQSISLPEQYQNNDWNDLIAREISIYNSNVEEQNKKLEQIMLQYPFNWAFVDITEKTSDQLRNEGFQFVLYKINTTGKNAKELLDYQVDDTETAFVSLVASNNGTSIKPIGVETPVYKYYIRHILTQDVYLGTKWDADTHWEQALINHFTGLRIELKVN